MSAAQQPEDTPDQTLRLPDLEIKNPSEAPVQPAHPAPEAYVGSYRLVKLLGDGAFGIVYLAYQPFLDRKIALKVLHTEFSANPRHEGQFMHEARTIAKLRHPNIVTVYEFGTTSYLNNTQTYMVMEYLPGETLYARLKRERLPLLQVIEIIEQLASALDYAHAHQVIHRDLKPANIIFSEQQQPVIVDFGLARLVEIGVSHETPDGSMQTSTLAGTPTYMAPEQAAGRAGGPASDQYALALIAYEMLTRKQAFASDSVEGMLKAKLEEAPPLLSKTAPELPRQADTVLQRALARDPAARYPTAVAFASAFSEALLPERVAGKVVTVIDPIQAAQLRSAQQNILGFLWGLIVLTLILIVFSIALFVRSYLNADPPFMWDGIIASSSTHDGLRDVIGFWPGSPAQQAGVQVGDTLRADIAYDRLRKDGDYTINGQPRSAYPVNWQPQEGDIIGRTFIRDGRPVQIRYPIQRSGYQLIVLVVQLPSAVLGLLAVIWLLRRWGAEPGAQLFTVVLLSGSFAVVASGVTNVLTNLDSLALFMFLPSLVHLVMVFPEPHPWIKADGRRVMLLYLPQPYGLVQFLVGLQLFDRVNVVIYAAYVVLLIVAIIWKWGRHDLKRYRVLGLLMGSILMAGLTALLAEAVAAFDDYVTVKTIWNGNGLTLLLVNLGLVSIGATLVGLFCTIGFHRVQQALGRSLPPTSDPAGKSPRGIRETGSPGLKQPRQ